MVNWGFTAGLIKAPDHAFATLAIVWASSASEQNPKQKRSFRKRRRCHVEGQPKRNRWVTSER